MSYGTRYKGAFYSVKGVVWRVEILQDGWTGSASLLHFPDEECLTIEWTEKAKHEPVQGSAATLKIISPSDRKYAGLYTVKPGAIRLDVYRETSLFWSGSLDTEQYEEPYITDEGYEVTLTFSDFGPLDRIPFGLSGVRTLRELVEAALEKTCINYGQIDESLISTTFEDGTALTLSSIGIPSENFYDEDGEASAWEDVLEGILQPLALRIVLRAGTIYVYDINGLCAKRTETRELEWDGDDAEMGADVVYNNVKVTFSPYSSQAAIDGTLDYADAFGPEWTNLTSDTSGVKYYNGDVPPGKTAPDCWSYYPDYDSSHRHGSDWDYSLIDFTLFRSYDSSKCKGLAELGASNAYFKIQPMLGGSESEGVTGGFYTGGHGDLKSGFPKLIGLSPERHTESLAMRTVRSYLPSLDDDARKRFFLQVKLPLLFDPRYNPFETESDGNEKGNYGSVKSYCQFAFVPVAITVFDPEGNALCHYDNRWLTLNGQPGNSVAYTAEDTYKSKWGWKEGAASFGDAWLAYYDPDDLVEGTGVLGWKTNRQSFGKPWTKSGDKVSKRKYRYTDKYDETETKGFWIFDSFKKLPEGQFIPYPPKGGYLEVTVYNGVWAFDDTERFSTDASGKFADNGLYGKIRWQLYQLPSVGIVRRTLTLDEEDTDDVEYTGEVNKDAKEGLEIDMVCGTMSEPSPSARGIYIRTSDGTQVTRLVRAGHTDHPEQLLIGTICSQHAERKTTLSGTAFIDPEGLTLYTERAQDSGARFMTEGETMDIRNDDTEGTWVETRPDEYTGKEEV